MPTNAHPTPEDSVILFADLQIGIATLPLTVPGDGIGKSASAIAQLAKLRGVPVIVSTVPADDGTTPKLIPQLDAALGPHQRFVRTVCDSAQDFAIVEAIQATGRKKVVISGVATEIAVSLPAYTLVENGYEVFVVVDACGGLSARTEDSVLQSLTQAGVHLTSVASLAGVFAKDFSESTGHQAIGILYTMAGG